MPRRLRLVPLLAGAVLLGGAPAQAQESDMEESQALTYQVRPLEAPPGPAPDEPRHADIDQEAISRTVIQGGRFAWLLREGADPTVAGAELVLDRNAPLSSGPGPLFVRGWPSPVEPYDTVDFSLARGDRDREVAGRPTQHYRLRGMVERRSSLEAAGHRYRVTADLWVLPDLPFSWAPFGAAPTSLPAAMPALRDTLQPALEELGLVARAVVRLDFSMIADGFEAGGSERVSGFQIDELRLTAEPPAPEPIIERSILDALERIYMEHPDRTCQDAADGDIPAILRARVGYHLWPPLVDMISSRCRRS